MTLGPQRRPKLALALPALASALLSLSQAAGAQAGDFALKRFYGALHAAFDFVYVRVGHGSYPPRR